MVEYKIPYFFCILYDGPISCELFCCENSIIDAHFDPFDRILEFEINESLYPQIVIEICCNQIVVVPVSYPV